MPTPPKQRVDKMHEDIAQQMHNPLNDLMTTKKPQVKQEV
jgi:hypothetical protein